MKPKLRNPSAKQREPQKSPVQAADSSAEISRQVTAAPPLAEPLTRAEFLETMKQFFTFAAGASLFGTFISTAEAQESGHLPKKGTYDPRAHAWCYLVDATKCIGCGMCVRACKIENNVPDDHYRTWIERYVVLEGQPARIDSPDGGLNGFPPEKFAVTDGRAFFVPKLCNQCENSPCSQVCPVGAAYESPEGIQLVDADRCIGCGYCVQACPYGSRFIDPVTHVANKCTWCYHRITKGLKPACVQACPTGTRLFGDMANPADPIRRLIATERVQILRPEMLTKPQVKYLGLDAEVR